MVIIFFSLFSEILLYNNTINYLLLRFVDSVKYYRDQDGYLYKKSGENSKTLYFDCLRQPNCIAGARYYKDSRELVHFSTHSDEKPDEHLFCKILFEEFLKNEACKSENANTSVLNLYKRAKNHQFKGIWLPNNHQTLFLAKLRRARNYEKTKVALKQSKKTLVSRAPIQLVDVATSPTVPESLVLRSSQNNLRRQAINSATKTMVVPMQSVVQAQPTSGANAITSTLPIESVTSSNKSSVFPVSVSPFKNKQCTPLNRISILQRVEKSCQKNFQRNDLNSTKEATVTHHHNSLQTQPLSIADATISLDSLSPIQNKDVMSPNQNSAFQRKFYSVDKGCKNNLRRQSILSSATKSTVVSMPGVAQAQSSWSGYATMSSSPIKSVTPPQKRSVFPASLSPIDNTPLNKSLILRNVAYSAKKGYQNISQRNNFLSPTTEATVAPCQSSIQTQPFSIADGTISLDSPSPIQSKNVTPSNESLIIHRIVYSSEKSSEISLRRNTILNSSNTVTVSEKEIVDVT